MSTSEKICCGLDVHKETIFAAINANGKAGEVKEYGTLTCQVRALSEWLKSNDVTDVAWRARVFTGYPSGTCWKQKAFG